mmetsp:Transcript_60445/g.128121  ORF Transcript_60445/g.128121 Transcript_60445/m.128121 type:complete len:789 (-) Transcript_60445:41-2407(-)
MPTCYGSRTEQEIPAPKRTPKKQVSTLAGNSGRFLYKSPAPLPRPVGNRPGKAGVLELEKAVQHAEFCKDRYLWLLESTSRKVTEAKTCLFQANTCTGRLRMGGAREALEEVLARLRPPASRCLLEAASLQRQVEKLPELRACIWARRAISASKGPETLRDAQSMVLALTKVLLPLLPSLHVIDARRRSPAEAAVLQILSRIPRSVTGPQVRLEMLSAKSGDEPPTNPDPAAATASLPQAPTQLDAAAEEEKKREPSKAPAASEDPSQKGQKAASKPRVSSQPKVQTTMSEDDKLKITYVSDVEGHWQYFCNFITYAKGLRFEKPGDHKGDRQPSDSKLVLEDGWIFVYGGDCTDKGPGSVHFVKVIVELKKRHMDRVHFILGNRDINKMRFTAEISESEIARLRELPIPYWVNEKKTTTALDYIRTLAAKAENIEEKAVTEAMIDKHNTTANRIRWMNIFSAGSDTDFELHREGIAHARNVAISEVSDDDVVNDYKDMVKEGGPVRDYLRFGKIAVILGKTLFVHGTVVCDTLGGEEGEFWAIDAVPGASPADDKRHKTDLRAWVEDINKWASSQIGQWLSNPLWSVPPTSSSVESWSGRGAHELLLYGTPAYTSPSVVYGRWLERSNMPKPMPPGLVQHLTSQGIHRIILGHTPHGTCPTIIPHVGLQVVMADTSFSEAGSHLAYKGDMRGSAVSALIIENGACRISGQVKEGRVEQVVDGQEASHHLGALLDENVDKFHSGYFIKAFLDAGSKREKALLCKMMGFKCEYETVDQQPLLAALEKSK